MTDDLDNLDSLRRAFIASIAGAHGRRTELAAAEANTRAFARALRTSGVGVEAALAEGKELIRGHTGADAFRFMPSLVGWMIAGYYAGYVPPDR